MNSIKIFALACAVCACGLLSAQSRTTYRDSMGRVQGTKQTDSYGKTTYRDAMGRVTGTSTTDSSGRTTYRDAMGRVTGTKQTR